MSARDQKNGWLRRLDGWPFVGKLWKVPPEALREARKEVFYSTLFSTMPFWFPVVGLLIFTGRSNFWDTISSGGLFIYAAAILGPLGYIVTKRHGRYRLPADIDDDDDKAALSYRFPAMQETFYFASFICILSGVTLTIQRFAGGGPTDSLVNETGVAVLSVVVALLATFLLFCVTAYRNMMEVIEREHSDTISSSLKLEADNAFDEWLDRKGD
ncbi:MAG: hypothetical protein ACTS1X_10350 [Parasphingopyxis sp.]|uniref:hypothetical protein n=1 Tax=Parasphingopyxis sp. TaxID=1920299 RepID=UPI003F9EE46A